MEIWNILGISPTEDKELIKKAYRKKLADCHPEEDPEDFQALRSAYESALRYEGREESGEAKQSETDCWLEQVNQIYQDFAKRLELANWEQLLTADLVCALDTEREAHYALLRYLMEHIYLPQSVFQLLGQFFLWEERKTELSEVFPANFITYLCNQVKHGSGLRYALFVPEAGRDYDGFIRKYFELQNSDFTKEPEQLAQKFVETAAMGILHPDFMILQARFALSQQDLAHAEELTDQLVAMRPEDGETLYLLGRLRQEEQKTEAARDCFLQLLEKEPDNMRAVLALGDLCFQEGDFAKAADHFQQVNDKYPYDRYSHHFLILSNQEIAGELKAQLEAEPENEKLKLNYLKAAVKGIQAETARDVGLTITGEAVQTYDYYDNMARACELLSDFEEALDFNQKALEIAGDNQEQRLSALSGCGLCCLQLKRYEEALVYYNQGIESDPACVKFYFRKAAVFNEQKKYPEAVECCNQALAIEDVPNAHHFRAEALFHMKEYERALVDCDQAIREADYQDTHVLKMKIFYEMGWYEELYQLHQQLIDKKAERSDMEMIRIKALMNERKFDDAYTAISALLEKEPDDQDACFQMALYYCNHEKYQDAQEYLEKADKGEENDSFYLITKADVLTELGEFPEAEPIYRRLLNDTVDNKAFFYCRLGAMRRRKNEHLIAIRQYEKALEEEPEHRFANGEIGDLLMQTKEFGTAITYYTRQLNREPSAYIRIMRAFCYERVKADDEAEADYKILVEDYPEYMYGFYHYAKHLLPRGEVEQAAQFMSKAVALGMDSDDALETLAFALLRLGQYRESAEYYNQLEARRSEESWSDSSAKYHFLKDKFFALYFDGNYKDAIHCAEKYGQQTSDRVWAYLHIGDCQIKTGDLKNALYWYKRARKFAPQNADSWMKIGGFYLKHKKSFWNARICYWQATRGSNNCDTWIERANAERKMGIHKNIRKCCETARTLLEKQEKSPCVCYKLGQVFFLLGDLDRAEALAKEAVELAPKYQSCYYCNCLDAWKLLGDIYAQKGEMAQAAEYYRKVLAIQEDEEVCGTKCI